MARRMVGSGGEEGEGSMSIVCELFPAAIADMNSVTSGSLLLSPCIYIIHSFSQQKVYKGKSSSMWVPGHNLFQVPSLYIMAFFHYLYHRCVCVCVLARI